MFRRCTTIRKFADKRRGDFSKNVMVAELADRGHSNKNVFNGGLRAVLFRTKFLIGGHCEFKLVPVVSFFSLSIELLILAASEISQS